MNRDRLLTALLAIVAVAYLAGLGLRPLLMPDEFRYAEVPREMIQSGDWIVPRLNGVVYFEKPVLGYWVTALSLLGFGENAFAARLPFALATLATAGIVLVLARRLGPGGRPELFAAAAFLTSVEVVAIGTAAVLDPLFTLGVTATLAALFVATERPPGAARRGWLAASGISCGVALLVKGPLALAIPAVVMGPYLVASKRSRDLLRLPWIPLAFALAVALPWSLAIGLAEPDFWHEFILEGNFRRFAGGTHAQHPEPFWFFLPVLVIGALPWTSLLVPVARDLRGLARESLSRFALCWLLGPLLLLSASSGKLPTYVLPSFPPLVLLFTAALVRMTEEARRAHLAAISIGIVAVCATTLVLLLTPLPRTVGLVALYDASEGWKLPVGAAGLLIAMLPAAFTRRAACSRQKVAGIVASMLLLCAFVMVAFPAWQGSKTPGRWLAERVDPIPPDATLVADRTLIQAVCWHYRRADVLMLDSAGELGYGLRRPDQRHRFLRWPDLERLIREPERAGPVVLLYRSDRLRVPRGLEPSRSDTWKGLSVLRWDAPGGAGDIGHP